MESSQFFWLFLQEIENLHECGAAFGETVTNQFLSLRLNMDRADDSMLVVYSKTHPHIINAATIISQYSQTPAPQRKEEFHAHLSLAKN